MNKSIPLPLQPMCERKMSFGTTKDTLSHLNLLIANACRHTSKIKQKDILILFFMTYTALKNCVFNLN